MVLAGDLVLMWLFHAPGTHNGPLQRCLALGRIAPEEAVILSGSEYTHSAPNCSVRPFSEAEFQRLAPPSSVVIFDVRSQTYINTPRQRTVYVGRTPTIPTAQPDVDLTITAGVYERVPWPSLVTEAWINPVVETQPAHDVVVVATGSRSMLGWFVRATVALLEAGEDAILVAPVEVAGVPSVVSTNAVDWIASAGVVVSQAGLTMYEALHHEKPFAGFFLAQDCQVRFELARAAGEAVVQAAAPDWVPAAVERARTMTPLPHPNGAPDALAAILELTP